MSQTQQPAYIQLEAGEDVTSIRDRLSFIRGRRVLLIWPEQGTTLERKLDLVLVQREAKRRVIQLALVTHDPIVRQHAEELGISVFDTVDDSERGRWKRGRTKVFVQRHHKPQDDPEPQDLMPVASRVRRNRRQWRWWQKLLGRLVVVAILALVIGSAVYVVIPSATIRLSLKEEQITSNITITASTTTSDINVEARQIPATILRATVQTNSTINTTGSEAVEDLRAIGFATFTNQTQRRIEIPANTVISTSSGTPVLFQTTEALTLSGGNGQRADVAIEAVEAGSEDNVGAGLINAVVGDLSADVTVRNLVATTGGESQSYAVVTDDDRERVLAIARGQLQALAYEEMRLNLTETQLIVIETISIAEERADWTTYSHEVGAITDTLTLNMRSVVEAVAIDDRFARQIVLADLSANKPRGLVIVPESVTYTRGTTTQVLDTGISFEASGEATIRAQANVTSLASLIAGSNPDDARAILAREVSLAENSSIDVQIAPDWMTRLPFLPVRIDIVTDETP
jgi:hypothetical protein